MEDGSGGRAIRNTGVVDETDQQLSARHRGLSLATFNGVMTTVLLAAKESYWTFTRAVGLGRSHGREGAFYFKAFAYPFYRCIAIILLRLNIRLIDAPENLFKCIGHLAIDFDSYIKDKILHGRNVKTIVVGGTRTTANRALLDLWSAHLRVVRNPLVLALCKPLTEWFPDVTEPILDYCFVMRGASRAHLIQKLWGSRAPILSLDGALVTRGEERLRALGIPDGAWFVCVHSREGGYAPQHEWASSYRNSDIQDYQEAMDAIVRRGGWCIRMGDASMRALPPQPGVVDYATSSLKADWMDLFLCSRCTFFLGNSSGLFGVAGIFGRPSALANVAPLGSAYSQFPTDICIPKLIADGEGNVWSFSDAFRDESSEFRYSTEFDARRLRHVNNTPQDISELVDEMLDRLQIEGAVADSDLQSRFRALVRPHHYCSHAASQIGEKFLQKHSDLLR